MDNPIEVGDGYDGDFIETICAYVYDDSVKDDNYDNEDTAYYMLSRMYYYLGIIKLTQEFIKNNTGDNYKNPKPLYANVPNAKVMANKMNNELLKYYNLSEEEITLLKKFLVKLCKYGIITYGKCFEE